MSTIERIYKFRVWDKEENKFFEPIYEAYKGNLMDLSIGLGGNLIRRTLQIPSEHQSCFPDRYELIQFTGLKDNNGIEIYEGDIIDWCSTQYVCKWNNNRAGYAWKTKSGNYIYPFLDLCKEAIIIGNIYEGKK